MIITDHIGCLGFESTECGNGRGSTRGTLFRRNLIGRWHNNGKFGGDAELTSDLGDELRFGGLLHNVLDEFVIIVVIVVFFRLGHRQGRFVRHDKDDPIV